MTFIRNGFHNIGIQGRGQTAYDTAIKYDGTQPHAYEKSQVGLSGDQGQGNGYEGRED